MFTVSGSGCGVLLELTLFFSNAFICSNRLLNEATGSLLDDVQLVNTLQTSKVTATEVSEQLESSEQTELKIDSAREVRWGDEVIKALGIFFFFFLSLG